MVALLLLAQLGCRSYDPHGCDSGCDSDSTPTVTGEPIVVNPYFTLEHRRPRNVIFLTYDTLRRDYVNAMGYDEHEVSPVLDRIFTEGVGFYDHRSCSSWTFPSFTCVLTGRDQVDNHFWPYAEAGISGTDLPEAPADLPLLAKIFGEMGYHTGVYAASGFLGSASAMDQGMDEGFGQFGSRRTDDEEMKAEEVLDYAIEYLDDRLKEPETPFFVHIHFIDPHMPWVPPEEFQIWSSELEPLDDDYFSDSTVTSKLWGDIKDGDYTDAEVDLFIEYMRTLYAEEILYADSQTARLFDYLEVNGVWEDTIVVFTSDHGEEFYEHGNFNHGYNSFDEQIRTPGGFYQPGNLRPARVDEMTLHQDLVPTLFELLGTDPSVAPSYLGFTGKRVGTDPPREWMHNLVYRFDGSAGSPDRTHQAVTDGKQKLMFRWDDDARSTENGGPKYFYEIEQDPGESDNVYVPDDAEQAVWWELMCPFIVLIDEEDKVNTPASTPECSAYR